MTKAQCQEIVRAIDPHMTEADFDQGWNDYERVKDATIYGPLDFIAVLSGNGSELRAAAKGV